MEDKQQLDVERQGSRSGYIQPVSLLILSLLLSGCVATIIYMSLHTTTCSAVTQHTPDQSNQQHQNIHLRYKDGNEIVDDVTYDSQREVSVLSRPGIFQVHDFLKGILIIKDKEMSLCYVVPTGADRETSAALGELMSTYDGEELEAPDDETLEVYAVPGEIEDKTFIPVEAHARCSTYQWVSVLNVSSSESGSQEVARYKRCSWCEFRDEVVDGVKDGLKVYAVKAILSLFG